MKADKFLQEYVKCGGKANQTCVSFRRLKPNLNQFYTEQLIKDFLALKGLLKNINYECHINPETGGCKHHPNFNKCCCSDCKNNIGYLHLMFEQEATFYARHFHGKFGFWREGKGCVLPHHRRSITCLTHHCNHEDEGHKHFARGMYLISRKLKDIQEELFQNSIKEQI